MSAGWREGDYSGASLKAALDRLLKERHARFLAEARNFLFQNYLLQERGKLDNPSLANLLQRATPGFCSRLFTIFAHLHRHLLARIFGSTGRIVAGLAPLGRQELSIEDKERAGALVEGLVGVAGLTLRVANEQLRELVELRGID